MPEREMMNRAWRNQIWQSPEEVGGGGGGNKGTMLGVTIYGRIWRKNAEKNRRKRWRVA